MPSVRSGPVEAKGPVRSQLRFWRALACGALGVCAYLLWRTPAPSAASAGATRPRQSSWALPALPGFGAPATPRAAPALAHLFAAVDQAGSVQARCQALSRLARTPDAGQEAIARIAAYTESGRSFEVRSCAVTALGEVLSSDVVPLLRELAGDPSTMIVEPALRALAQRPEPESRATILTIARSGALATRIMATLALAEAGAPEASALLIELLESAPPQERERLLLALGATHDPQALGALKSLLAKAGPALAPTVIAALGELGGEGATRLLMQVLRERPAYANPVYFALARSHDPAARAALLSAAEQAETPALASTALQALQTLEGEDVRALMERALQSSQPLRVNIAIDYFANHADAAGIDALAELAQRGGTRVAPQALYALARIGGADARDVVESLASAGGPVGDAALSALSTMPDAADEAQRLALAQLKDGGAAKLSPQALDLIGRDGSAESRAALIAIAEGQGRLSGHAAMLLAQRDDVQSRAALERIASSDRPPEQRGPALFALAQAAGADAAKTLRGALSSEHASVRAQAVQALVQAGGDGIEQDLIGATRDRDIEVASMAVGALAQLGSKGALDRLEQVASASQAPVARQALMSLSSVDPVRSAAIAERLAASSDPAARQTALAAAPSLPEETATRIVVSALRDSDPAVVAQAVENLGASGYIEAAARPALLDLTRDARVPAELRERAQQVLTGAPQAVGHEGVLMRSFR